MYVKIHTHDFHLFCSNYCCYMKLGLSDARIGRFGTLNGPCWTCRCSDTDFPVMIKSLKVSS